MQCISHTPLSCEGKRKKLVTKNIHSEIIYNVSASRNISKALKTFGLNSTTRNILIVALNPTQSVLKTVQQIVDGVETTDIDEQLKQNLDVARFSKAYDVSKEERKWIEDTRNWSLLVNAVVSRISVRDLR